MKWKTILTLAVILLISSSHINAQFDFFEKKVSIGGYGEMHYNYIEKNEDISKTLTFHRFVLFFGYSFSEKWSFKSEVEIEHNYVRDGAKNGYLSLEQAFIDYHFKDYLGFQAGVLLVSSGLTNIYHEPTNFLSVERPRYSRYIIPSTWFGNGFSMYGTKSGFEYKFNFMEGLNSDRFSLNKGIRNGRQKGSKADASAMIYNLMINYVNIPGLNIGGSIVYNDAVGDTSNTPLTLIEVHADFRKNGFIVIGEYGNINYKNSNLEQSAGFYLDFGYDFARIFNWEWQTIPFVRYTDFNTAASTINGGDETKANHHKAWMVGVSVLPLDSIVLKADYSIDTVELNSVNTTYFNLGIGYRF
ncbi:MAG: OprO/OprP family phosphate-selective porin [Melioribacteraceae bacterium]|nr:OprO/OprP family phosphate-selective porin [Melioribacteraceae bacterium]